jgi:peroxiredoxin
MRAERKRLIHIGCGLVLAISIIIAESVTGAPIKDPNPVLRSGDPFPSVSFPSSLTSEEKRYLAIGEKKTIHLEEIKAELIVIKFLNTNCVYCIKLLPIFYQIYQSIEQNTELKEKIRIIGISTGDTPAELQALKDEHPVPYPVLLDPEFRAHRAVGEPRLPFIVVARKDKLRRWVVATVHIGLIFSAENFIGELKAILMIDPETLRLKKP